MTCVSEIGFNSPSIDGSATHIDTTTTLVHLFPTGVPTTLERPDLFHANRLAPLRLGHIKRLVHIPPEPPQPRQLRHPRRPRLKHTQRLCEFSGGAAGFVRVPDEGIDLGGEGADLGEEFEGGFDFVERGEDFGEVVDVEFEADFLRASGANVRVELQRARVS